MNLVLSTEDQRAVGRVLELLSSPLEWPSATEWRLQVLQTVAPLFQAEAGALVIPHEGEPPVTLLDRPTSYLDAYLRYQALDVSIDHALERHAPVTCTLEVTGGDRRLYRHSELYACVYGPYEIEEGIWSFLDLADAPPRIGPGRVFAPRGVAFTGMISLYSERVGKPRFAAEGLALMTLLRPALRAAAQAWTDLDSRRHTMSALIDESGEGLAVFDSSGALLHRNPSLAQLLASEPQAEAVESAARDMARAFAAMRRDPAAALARACRTFEEAIVAGAGRYRLRATSAETMMGQRDAIIIHVERLSARRPAPAHVRRRFGLTQREAEVALLLASGRANREISRALGISEHTTRRHTEKVLAKLGLQRRSQVAFLLADASLWSGRD